MIALVLYAMGTVIVYQVVTLVRHAVRACVVTQAFVAMTGAATIMTEEQATSAPAGVKGTVFIPLFIPLLHADGIMIIIAQLLVRVPERVVVALEKMVF